MTTGEEKQEAPVTIEKKVEVLETVTFEIIDRLEKLTAEIADLKKTAVTKPKGLFGGKREAVPIKDLSTGEVYHSMAAVNKAFGPEIGIDPLKDTLGYYKIEKKLLMEDGTKRFVPANADEAAESVAAYKKQIADEVAAANEALEAEQLAEQELAEKKAKAEKAKK